MDTRRPLALLDLDGTLVDSLLDVAWSVNEALASMDLPRRTIDEVQAAIGHGARHLIRELLPTSEPDEAQVDDLLERFRAVYAEHTLDRTQPFDGIPEALRRLSEAGVVLAVMTNKPEDMARRVLDGLDLARWMAAVVGGDTTEAVKPDLLPLRLAVSRAEETAGPVRPCTFVGDGSPDLEAARALEVPFVGVTWGKTPREAWTGLAPTDRLVDTAVDLADAVLALR
ncbi:MAG: HAD family hydrolase [Myxococcota bacterium]